MNYERIYADFIADRRAREPGLTGYVERHHITPRAIGGGDEPANLISLTAEDHFFAHLLLAKVHNTHAAWAAVMVMHERGNRCDIFKQRARLRYGWARRRYGRFCSDERVGTANPNYKHDIITLKREDGQQAARTRTEWNSAGIPHAALRGVMTGKSGSYKGWMLPETDPASTGRGAAGKSKRIKTKYDWRHFDGRTESLSPYDMAEKHGLRANDVTSVVRGEHAVCGGWSIRGRKAGWPCGRQHFTDDRVHTFVHVDGRSLSGTQRQIADSGALVQQDVSALVNGRRQSAHGWMTEASHRSGFKPRLWKPRLLQANDNGPSVAAA